jgi:hypothetical protein
LEKINGGRGEITRIVNRIKMHCDKFADYLQYNPPPLKPAAMIEIPKPKAAAVKVESDFEI